MQINITFRKMDPEERIKAYVEEKLAKVKKYLNEPIEAHVVLSTEKFRKGAEVNITADGLVINGSENREDIYAAIDLVVDKLERQIKRQKEKAKGRLSAFKMYILSPTPEEGPRVIRSKSYSIKPMSLEEAIEELNALGNDFVIFTNAETDEVNVLYRRKDGNYGLIEPE